MAGGRPLPFRGAQLRARQTEETTLGCSRLFASTTVGVGWVPSAKWLLWRVRVGVTLEGAVLQRDLRLLRYRRRAGHSVLFQDLPASLDAQSLHCLRMCMWEPSDIAPAIATADVDGERRTRVDRHRHWLREAATCPGSRIPLCLVPNALVQYLRTALGVLTTENQRAAVRIV